MIKLGFFITVYCITSVFSIVLLGDRNLISGNLLNLKNLFLLAVNIKFIISMLLAIFARFSFIMINNTLLSMPRLAGAATTITTFLSLIFLIFVVIANYYFLQERLSLNQGIGAFIIMFGVFILLQ